MPSAMRIAGQVLAWAAFAAVIGVFSTWPAYRQLSPDNALVKLSFSHGAQRKLECRERSEAELARLAPNMRAKLDCPRERANVLVELDMDGRPLYRLEARPSGLRGDGPSVAYRRLEIPAGRHHFRARLSDTADGVFNHTGEATVELAPGAVLVVDFVASTGGFKFRSPS